MKRLLEIIFIVFTSIFLIGVLAMVFQVVGEDSPNKATIIGGLLSMIGGAIGALSAFLIAKMQLTKQLELQDKKNREMFLAELKIKKAEEVLVILFETRMAYFSLKGTWDSYVLDCDGYSKELINEKFNKDELKNLELLDAYNTKRDEFIKKYHEIFYYRTHFKELIYQIIDDQEMYFKPLTMETNEIIGISLGLGKSNQFNTYIEFRKKWIPRVSNMEKKFDNVIELIHAQIISFEEEIEKIVREFRNN